MQEVTLNSMSIYKALVAHPLPPALLSPLGGHSLFSAFHQGQEKERKNRRGSSLHSNWVLCCLPHGFSAMPGLFEGKEEA